MTFTAWLLAQGDRSDPVGHLAYEAHEDADFPAAGSIETCRDYLAGVGASPEALAALEQAGREFAQRGKGRL
jgi:YozE SAM-like fold